MAARQRRQSFSQRRQGYIEARTLAKHSFDKQCSLERRKDQARSLVGIKPTGNGVLGYSLGIDALKPSDMFAKKRRCSILQALWQYFQFGGQRRAQAPKSYFYVGKVKTSVRFDAIQRIGLRYFDFG